MENINIFDLVVVALITVLGLKGLFRGFIKEFFALVGIIGGVFVASRLANDAGELVNSIIPMQNENTVLLAGFVSTLVVFWIIAYLVGSLLSNVLKMSGLGIIDRILGFIFGAGKIFLLFSIISYAISQVKMINDNIQPKLKTSVVFPLLQETGNYIVKLDTSGLQDEVSGKIDVMVDNTKDNIKKITNEEIDKKIIDVKNQLKGSEDEK